MQSTQDIKYGILAFQKITSYPKEGSFVLVDPAVIEQHIKTIDEQRNPMFKAQAPIVSKFSQFLGTSDLFYKSDPERKFGVETMTAVKVTEIYQHKKTWYVKCLLNMILWPADINEQDKYIHLDADECTVINPVMCDAEWTYDKQVPDNINKFGMVVDQENKIYISFDKDRKLDISELPTTLEEYGLKEFSKLMHPPEAVTEQPKADVQKIDFDLPNPTEVYESIFESHPLSEFTRQIYEQVLITMNQHKIPTTNEFREDLELKFKDLTIQSEMSVKIIKS